MLRSLKRIIYKLYNGIKWFWQFFICLKTGLYHKCVKTISDQTFDNPLILVPHSDDEWIGPYSILKNARDKATCIYFNLFGDNTSEENIKKRNSEIVESAKFWGFKLEHNYKFDIVSLSEHLKKHVCIFIPSPYDWHPEHRMVFQTLYQALLLLPEAEFENKQIFYYSVSVPHRLCESVHYVPLTMEDINAKWTNFKKIYHSQSFMPALRYKLNLRLVPKECGYAAQFYVKVDANRLKRDYEKSRDEIFITEADRLIYSINNIVKIRKQISKL